MPSPSIYSYTAVLCCAVLSCSGCSRVRARVAGSSFGFGFGSGASPGHGPGPGPGPVIISTLYRRCQARAKTLTV